MLGAAPGKWLSTTNDVVIDNVAHPVQSGNMVPIGGDVRRQPKRRFFRSFWV
jgi:hypothetical protein